MATLGACHSNDKTTLRSRHLLEPLEFRTCGLNCVCGAGGLYLTLALESKCGSPPPHHPVDANYLSTFAVGPTGKRLSLVGVRHSPSSLETLDATSMTVLSASRCPGFQGNPSILVRKRSRHTDSADHRPNSHATRPRVASTEGPFASTFVRCSTTAHARNRAVLGLGPPGDETSEIVQRRLNIGAGSARGRDQ